MNEHYKKVYKIISNKIIIFTVKRRINQLHC